MANNIKGITVEIGGDTGPLSTALKGANKTSGDLQSELKEVNKQLKFDPSNTTLLNQKMDLLKQNTQALEEKQKTLKTAVSQAQEQFEKGDLGADKVRAVEREYEKVTSQLKDTKTQLNEVEKTSGTFSEKVKAQFSSLKDKIKDTFSSENIKAGLGAVGVAVGTFLKGATDSATAAQEKTDALTNLLQNQGMTAKDAGKTIDQFTSSITKMSSFSGGEAKDALQELTQKGVSSGEALKNSALLANIAAGSHKTLAESADLLADAYNGKTKALTSLGILTKDEAKNLGDSENATISMADVQDRLNERFGGAAQAQLGTYAGKMKENTNQVNAAKTAIGTALLPVLAEIADMAAKVLVPIANFIKQNPQLTAAILAVIAIVGTLVGGLSLLNTVMTAVNITQAAGMAAVLPVVGIVAGIITVIALLVIGVKHLWDTNEGFRTAVTNIWNGIKTVVSTVVTALVGFFTITIPQAWSNLVAFMQTWGPLILTVVAPIIGIPLLIIQHWSQIQTFFESLWNSIISFFTQTIPQWVNNFIQWINQLPYYIGLAIGTMIADIINFGVDAWNWVTTKLPQIINGIIQWFQQLPGKIWAFLTDIVTKIGQWITGMGQKVAAGIPVLINNVATFFSELPGRIWTFLVDVVSKVVQWCANLVSTAGTEIPKFVQTVVDFIGELPGKMLDIGKNIVTGIWDGINGAISWLHDKITSFCQGIVDGIKKNLKIHSPSQVLADEVGKYMALGIGQGFTDAMQSVTAAMAAAIPTSFDSSVQVRTAMAAAYGGYSAPASTTTSITGSAATATGSTGDVKVYQYFQGKTPSPAEHARLTRNGLQQVVKKLKG